MVRYIQTVWILALSLIRRFFRDKVALFFTFLFPLLFLFVFGSLNNTSGVSFNIVLVNHSKSEFAKQFEQEARKNQVFKINDKVTNLDDAKERMGRGELDSIIELPASFGEPNKQHIPSGKLIVYYEESSPQTGQTLASIMQQQLDVINQKLTHHTDPFLVEQKATKTADLSSFDYVFSGLLGFSILSLGIFGMANSFPADKKAGILRRLRATPLRSSQLILATAINYLLVGALSIVMMFVVGTLVFDFQMRGDYLSFSIFTLVSIITMFGFGLAIGGWAKNENQAAPLSNLVAFPLMFLSGTFFPRFLMPDWLEGITKYLPLTPIVDGLRYITTEGKTLMQLGTELLIMTVWIIIIYLVAIRFFRWE